MQTIKKRREGGWYKQTSEDNQYDASKQKYEKFSQISCAIDIHLFFLVTCIIINSK